MYSDLDVVGVFFFLFFFVEKYILKIGSTMLLIKTAYVKWGPYKCVQSVY